MLVYIYVSRGYAMLDLGLGLGYGLNRVSTRQVNAIVVCEYIDLQALQIHCIVCSDVCAGSAVICMHTQNFSLSKLTSGSFNFGKVSAAAMD